MTAPPRNASSVETRPANSAIVRWWRSVDSRPLVDYYMIVSCVLLLSAFGIVMVVASSGAASVAATDNVWSFALKQVMLMGIGFVCMWAAMKINPARIQQLAWVGLAVSTVLLVWVLIAGIGQFEVGSKSWIVLGPIRFQPSEIAKIAIGVYGAAMFAHREPGDKGIRRDYIKFAVVSLIFFLLIYAQHDLGMAMAFATMVAFVFIFAGVPWIAVGTCALVAAAGLVQVMLSPGYRSDRFTVYFDALRGHFGDTRNMAFQSYQGFLSLAEGGVSGVGIGQSRAKWFYLPEARNDFIFSIIGEENGLFGAVMVIGLYTGLLWFGLRCASKQNNRFLGLLAACLTCGVVSQAYINMAYVVGLLPVTGIQLPLISSGGTSAVITLTAMGVLANCARHEPDAVVQMATNGRPLLDRLLLLGEPTQIRRPRRAGARRPVTRAARPVAGAPQDRTPAPENRAAGRGRYRPNEAPVRPHRRAPRSGHPRRGPAGDQ